MIKRKILTFILTFLFALTTIVGAATPDPLKVHFISTGNSDAILVQDNGKNMLIDGGDNDDGVNCC